MALTKWRMLSDGTGMYRPWGRTWPEISLFTGKVMMRDNNSKRPSQTIETDVITVENVTSLIRKHISEPHPPSAMIEQFIAAVNEKLKK